MPTQLIRVLSLVVVAISTWVLLVAGAGDDTTSSIYDALSSHGLPMGLLPKGVKHFTLDGEGRFEVHLDQACNAKFESELHYEQNVSGMLSYGQIGNLTGVAAQELFLWFPVKGIRVDVPSSGLIYFDVGVVSKQFSLSLFETPPDCLVGPPPPAFDEGKSIIRTLAKSRDTLLIRKNMEENQDEKMWAKDDPKGPR